MKISYPIPAIHPGRRRGGKVTTRTRLSGLAGVLLAIILGAAIGNTRCGAAVFLPLPGIGEDGRASTNKPAAPKPGSFATMDTLDDKHKLAGGDRLSFRIVEDQEDPNEKAEPKPLIVTDHGDVEVPYVGRFPAEGKTCKQLAKEIKTELEKEYYFQATVIIGLDLLAKSTGAVYVLGEVRQTGPVQIPGDETFTVSKAILRAGGFTTYSDKKHVKLTRKEPPTDGSPQTVILNAAEVLEKGKADKDLPVEAGDIIYVPSRLFTL